MRKTKIIIIAILSLIIIYLVYRGYYILRLNNILSNKSIYTINEEANSDLTITITKGDKYASLEGKIVKYIIVPQMAIWMEDTDGNFIKTIYVTPKLSKINRDAALPVWEHKKEGSTDSVSTATPKENSSISIKKPKDMGTFKIFLEINKSYDSNKYYGLGKDYSGQPSLIYETTIDDNKKNYIMTLIGHGSITGKDGLIYDDMKNITTALNILEEVKVNIK